MFLTILFCLLFVTIFGKLVGFAIKFSWSLIKIILCFVALPLVLIGLVISGLAVVAVPLLIIVGAATIFKAVLA